MGLKSLEELFLHTLKDTYDAEKRIAKALPRLKRAASSPDLKMAFDEHRQETESQIERLEQVFELLQKPPRSKKCVGIMGLIEEGSELIEEGGEDPVVDAGLICAAQKVEHYEIAAYGTLVTYARILGYDEALPLLEQTLEEEKTTDQKLSDLALSINQEAEVAEAE